MKNFENEKPLVSICCITYNHAKYIRDALDGFMMQETDFPFEVLIHDDASTDGTADIIREYEKKYPGIIKPIYQTENQYSKGVKISTTYNYPRAQGKYIALCEGDDFWTDKHKLQVQFDFMENHLDYSMCFHGAVTLGEHDSNDNGLFSHIEERDYQGQELLETWTVPTASSFFRTEYSKYIPNNKDFWCGDIIVWLTMSQYGKIRAQKQKMSVYRQLSTGAVSTLYCKMDEQWLNRQIRFYEAIKKEFSWITREYIAYMHRKNYYLHLLYLRKTKGFFYTLVKFFRYSLFVQCEMVILYLKFRLYHKI